ncbi:MAG: hypothetical protein M0Z61_00585 [Nitrospiraceae bacterium]|nr:hypothetical protein [Nitrospiraceae bacterium]
MSKVLNDLKKHTFFSLLGEAGRVFVLVMPSDDAVVGTRGFLPEEMEKGIVLVFNSRMNFDWGEQGISARLVFGTTAQECFIPADDIIAVFSPELEARLIMESRAKGPSKQPSHAQCDFSAPLTHQGA